MVPRASSRWPAFSPERVVLVGGPGVTLAPPHATPARPWVRAALLLIGAAAVAAAAAVQGYVWLREDAVQTRVGVARVDVPATLFPVSPVTVRVFAGGEDAFWASTDREVVSSTELWRRMHLSQWNDVPVNIRTRALDNMLMRYQPELVDPSVWDRMSVADWDAVPQPIRTVAYRHMVDYWVGFYQLGSPYALSPRVVADTLAAVVMSESWFDHRAYFVNAHGNQDLGLAQASDYARRRMRELYATGQVDAALDDGQYYNPWHATRFAAIWMTLLLDEAEGDLDTAVAAYHRGITSAHDARGREYLRVVQQRLNRYIRNGDAPEAWSYLWGRARHIAQQHWPWLRSGSR